MNPEDFTQYREQCESYRQRLVTSRNEVLDAYGKTLTTLSGGAIGLVMVKDGTWYAPNDGGCGPNEANWKKWLEAGYVSRAQAEVAAKK